MAKNYFDQFDEPASSGGSNFFDQFDGESTGKTDVRRVDNKIEADAEAAPQEVVTSARAWRGAGAGRGKASDERRLDVGNEIELLDRERGIEKLMKSLRVDNAHAKEADVRALAEMLYDASDKSDGPAPSAEERQQAKIDALVKAGYQLENAQAKADFDKKFNERQAKKEAVDPLGRKAQISDSDGLQNTQQYIDEARAAALERIRKDRVQALSDEMPISSALASGIGTTAVGLANAPQAILNAPIEIVDKIGSALTGKQLDLPTLPKWSGTEKAMEFFAENMPSVANKSIEQSRRDGDMGMMLLTNLAANSPSNALSLIAMFAPPLRAALLPTMGAMATGQSYATGDGAMASVLKGLVEVGTERLPLEGFDKTVTLLNKMPVPVRNNVLAVAGQKLLKAGAAITATSATNAIEEAAAQVGGNAIDMTVQSKPVGLMDDVGKSALIGAASGGALSAPHVAQIAMQPGSVQSQIERAIADSLTGGEFAPIGPEAVHLANINPNLAKATVADIAVSRNVDEATAAFVSATSPSAPTTPLSEAIPSDVPNTLAPNAGVRDTSGGDNAAAGVDIVGTGLPGDVTGGVAAGRVGAIGELSTGVSDQPLSGTAPVQISTDANLLSRVPLDAGEEYLGPNGDGYQTEKSAETKRVWAAKNQPELDWKIEPLDNGKFRVAGYPKGASDGQQINGRMPVSQAGGVSPQGDGVLRSDANAGGVPALDQDVAARESFQRSLDDAHASDPSSPKVTLNPPAQAEAAQLERALEQTRALFGVRTNVRFFSDTDPNSVNGVHDKSTNTVWVNTAGLSYNALGTGFHETHHVMQAMAEADDAAGLANTPAQRYRDKVDDLFDSMSEAGKRSYIENFLYKDKLKTIPMSRREEAIQRMLVAPLTRREMMADFIGNRATDKAFIRSLAKADPVGFKEWAKRWLEILDNLLATLKGDGKNKESINVDKYVADLKQARKVVVEALVEFRQAGGQAPAQQDSAPAFQGRQNPGGGRRFVSVDEFDAYDPDTTGELGNFDIDRAYAEDMATQGIVEDNNAAAAQAATSRTPPPPPVAAGDNPNSVTLEHMKQHGLFPEKAFPFERVRKFANGIAIDAHAAYPNITIQKQSENQYTVETSTGDWFTNGSKFTEDVAITLGKAHASRGMVFAKKFDLASAYRKSTLKKLVAGWKRIAEIPGAFALNKTSSSTDLVQIARDLGAFKDHVFTVGSSRYGETNLLIHDNATGKVYNAQIHASHYGSDGFAINTMGMRGSSVGSDVYSVVAVYATNTNQKFYCDGFISAVNTFRRTEQAFSYALKTGDSGVLLPGYQNRVYGHDWEPKTQDDHDMNIARLALANMRNVMEVLPDRTTRENGSHRVVYNERTKRFVDEDGKQTMIGLTRMTYDLTTGRFGDQSGRDITEAVLDWIKDPLNRGTGIGSSTLARAIITNQIIKGTLDIDSVLAIGKPVAYQKRQGILDATDAQPVENVAEKQYDYDAALESKWERISRFVNDHPRLVQQFEKDAANGKEEAAIMRLIARTGFRIGGSGSSKGEPTFGAASLMAEHVGIKGDTITFNFRGKSGVQQVHTFVDRALAKDLKARLATGRERLFTKADRAVRKYHDSVIGDADYKVHDYRTMVATVAAKSVVDSLPQPQNADELKAAIRLAAEEAGRKIGDDYATALKSYIHPDVFAGWRAGLQQGESGVQERAGKSANRVAQAEDLRARGRGDAEPEAGAVAYSRKQDVSPIGFYSALSRAIDGVNASAAPAAGWKDAVKGLINKGTVKADEVEWTGLNDWLDLQKGRVTKEQVQEFLRGSGVQVQEVQLGVASPELRALRQRLGALQDEIIAAKEDFQNSGYLYREVKGYNLVNRLPEKWQYRYDKITRMQEEYDQLANEEYDSPAATPTKYSQYTLPGGENYREVLLTLPEKSQSAQDKAEFDHLSRLMAEDGLYEDQVARWEELGRRLGQQGRDAQAVATYRSSHWDQANVLAHIRLNDRTDADGKRVLFVEEIQSDWGQEGKKRGFTQPVPFEVKERSPGYFIVVNKSDGQRVEMPGGLVAFTSREAAQQAIDDGAARKGYGVNSGIPTAPFVTKTEGWLNLALKRIMVMAAEGGYDRVAFVNGEQSADRYDLSQHINRIDVKYRLDGTFDLDIHDKSDGKYTEHAVEVDSLPDMVGKEMAQKILSTSADYGKKVKFSGLDLKVGGEGMKTFYDSIVPKATNELLRKLKTGAKLGEVAITGNKDIRKVRDDDGTFALEERREDEFGEKYWEPIAYNLSEQEANDRLKADGRAAQPGFDVTDAMRERVDAGMPLFQRRQSGLPDERRLKRARRKLQDSFVQVKVLQDFLAGRGGVVGEAQDVYLAEERMHGRTQEFLRDFAEKQIKPLTEKAVKYGIELDELALYAYAKHAEERNRHIASINRQIGDAGSGMDNDTAKNIIQMVELEGNKDKFDELHQMLMGITSTTRRVLLQEGLITQEEYDTWESQYENYIPLRGFENVDDDGVPRPGLGRGFTIKGKESMRAMGRKSRAGDLIENVIRDHERAVIRGERNQVAKVFLDLALSNPDPNLWEVAPVKLKRSIGATGLVRHKFVADTSGPDVFTLKVGGNEVHIRIKDPLLMRAMAAIHKAEISDLERALANSVGIYTNLLRNTLTRYNPAFGFLNAFKDAGMGAFSTYSQIGAKGMAKYFAHYLPSVIASAKVEVGYEGQATMDKWMREMRFAGGTTGGFQMRDVDEIKDDLRDLMLQAGAAPKGMSERMRSMYAYKMAQKFLRVLEFFGAVSENAARAAAYRAARESGMSVAKASSVAKNLTTNFNRKGEWGGTINSLYLFYNASVQGSATLLKLMTHPRAIGLAASISAVSMALALMAANAGDDDDGEAYWDKIPDFEKERNLIIMLPPKLDIEGAQKIGKHGRYIKIPVQYGINVFVVLGYQLADLMRNMEDPKRGAGFAKAGINLVSTAMGSFNPFGGSIEFDNKHSIALAALPTGLDAAYQLWEEVNGFGRTVAPKQYNGDSGPDSERFFPAQAGGTAQRFARWLNANTGGNQARSGGIDVTPGTIENVVALTTGGLGRFLYDVSVNIPTKLIAQADGHDVEIKDKDIPFWKNFYAEIDGDQGMRDYFERTKRAKDALAVRKEEVQLGQKHELTAEEKALIKMGELASAYTEQMSLLRKKELAVAENEKLSKGEKMVKRREINKQREKLADSFNKHWVKEMGIYDAR